MQMKKMIRNSSVLLTTFLVMFLSIGLNVSKMKCAEDGTLYLGTEVPSCSMETEVLCGSQQVEMSCCKKEIITSCCPETNDNSCASETENIHFDFETLLSEYEFTFVDFSIELLVFYAASTFQAKQLVNNCQSGIPPPKLKRPIFSQIQAFLL